MKQLNVAVVVVCCQIHLHTDNFKMANQSLEIGLSFNFEVGLSWTQFVFSCPSHLELPQVN